MRLLTDRGNTLVCAIAVATATIALAACTPAEDPGAERGDGVEVNDVHSRLNETRVREVVAPETIGELSTVVQRAGREGLPISISGGRHAMGGQQFASGALHVDMSRLDRVVALDRERGVVTVEAGVQWPKLIDDLLALQPDDPQPWTIVQKQTGADNLSIGGAVAANIHGRGLGLPPFVSDVEAFRLMRADGREIEVSREQNPELFGLASGGYGLFGIITTVDLRLQRRTKLQRDVVVATGDEAMKVFEERIREGYTYGDFQFKTDEHAPDFMQVGVASMYRPVPISTPMPPAQQSLNERAWHDLFILAHLDKARAFAAYRDYYLGTTGQIYWSDTHQLSYYDDFETSLREAAPGMPDSSLMIAEVYVPRPRLADFLRVVADDFRVNDTNLIYGTVRLIERDTESFLAWAREPYACVVMNLRVDHSPDGIEKAKQEFQRLIDRALERGGSFFLTYHRWARRDQILSAYPQFVEFLRLKRTHDPDERFQSDWYRHYRDMFAQELAEDR